MNQRILTILSLLFSAIPAGGELFLFTVTGEFNNTILFALAIAIVLLGNLLFLVLHNNLTIAQIVFCTTLVIGITAAIAVDGGIESPLWFFQLLAIFGAGFLFGKFGALVAGLYVLISSVGFLLYYGDSVTDKGMTEFTSVFASTVLFSVLCFLYERTKEQQTSYLVAANEELSQFSYRTSHDLRAPLISVKRLAELVTDDMENGEMAEAGRNIQRIESQIERLDQLVLNMLSLSKASIDVADVEPLDLPQVVTEILEHTRLTLPEKKISIETEFNHTGIIISSRTRISQVLENLITNAFRYSDPTESNPYLKIVSQDLGNLVEMKLLDNGLGISEKFSDRIFSSFERFHPEVGAGTGLGLFLVKKHVEKLGGKVSYTRTEDGSLFSITFRREST